MSYVATEQGYEIGLFEALERCVVAKANWRERRRTSGRAVTHTHTLDGVLVEFMAEIFPDEGLDIVLGQWPLQATRLSTTYLCLFTSQSASTVITSGQAMANVTETTYTSYARQALAGASWGAAAAGSGGRKTTFAQITFPTVGATGATINGFFIGDATPPVKCIAQANFDDVTAVVLATNDIIKVTPTVQFNN